MANKQRGLTLIEMVVAVGIFAVLLSGVIGLFSLLIRSVKVGREQTVLANLASSYSEIMRNLPYDQVGTVNGNPAGTLADATNPIINTIEGRVYHIYYEVTYVDDPADGTILLGSDPAANDYKQVKMSVENMSTSQVSDFVTTVTPKGLENTSNAGALYLQVIDANGQPVPAALVHIENLDQTLILNRQTDASGNWIEVGLPAGVNEYHIVTSKNTFSNDQTYPITIANPNPIKPDATVINGQITQVSFAIDRLSALTVRILNSTCGAISNINVNISGSKLIGTNPDVLKYNADSTSAGGQISLANREWDNYVPTLLTGQNLMILGTSPIQQISVLPASSATYTMILGAKTANSFLTIVKESGSGTALENANVTLTDTSNGQVYNGITGGSIWVQKAWDGGAGQATFSNPNQYFADDGNISLNAFSGGVELKQVAGNYVNSGSFESSTFDTGGSSNYTTISWQPTSQDPVTTLKFQIATNNDNSTWNYVGPDGTGSTYYTVSGSNIAATHDNDRFIRYKALLETTDSAYTPILTNIGMNYVAGCFTPGQVNFGSLPIGNYDISVSLAGYQNYTVPNLAISGNQSMEILMSP